MELVKDLPNYKIITSSDKIEELHKIKFENEYPEYAWRLNNLYNAYNNYIVNIDKFPRNKFESQSELHYLDDQDYPGDIDGLDNQYNDYQDDDYYSYKSNFNVKHNIYYKTLIIYNDFENRMMPDTLIDEIAQYPDVVLHLINYNYPIDNLPLSVRVIILNYVSTLPNSPNFTNYIYNYNLNNLPLNLTEFICNMQYFKSLDMLPHTLLYLNLNYHGDLPLDNLPPNLLEFSLELSDEFKQPMENLPRLLECLTLTGSYAQKLVNLPHTLKELDIGSNYYSALDNLPENLETLKIGGTLQSLTLPPNLKKFYFGFQSLFATVFPDSLEYIYCDYSAINLLNDNLFKHIPANLQEINVMMPWDYMRNHDKVHGRDRKCRCVYVSTRDTVKNNDDDLFNDLWNTPQMTYLLKLLSPNTRVILV